MNEGYELTLGQALYGDELAPQLIINRLGSCWPRLCWVAYEPDVWPGGISVALEWVDPETGVEISCVTEQIPSDPEMINRLSRIILERGFSVIGYKAAGRLIHRYIKLDNEAKNILQLRFNGQGVGGRWIWPFTVVTRVSFS
ncbi:hypothetical protein [Brevundimonas sp. R86498]|uniref:hypothetical protein n=1 Tax=Brevundimonas sp. R86498 TaxID=3093845 RepID=UPI0037CB089C